MCPTPQFADLTRSLPWTVSNTGDVTKCIGADVTFDRLPEFLALDGGTLSVGYGVGYFNCTQYEVPGVSFSDFDIAPGAGPSAQYYDANAIVATAADGLHMLVYEPTVEDPANPGITNPFLIDSVIDASSPWLGAQRVFAEDLQGNGVLGLIGLGLDANQDAKNLLFRADLGSGATSSVLLPEVPFDLVPMNYDNLGPLDVAAICPSGIWFVTVTSSGATSASATPDLPFSPPLTDAIGARFRQPDVGTDRLALVATLGTPLATANYFMSVVDVSGVEPVVALGASQPHALTAADFDGDGAGDLLIANRVAHNPPVGNLKPILFTNQYTGGTAPQKTFDYGLSTWIDFDTDQNAGADQRATPVAVDLMRDGDLDLAMYVASSNSIEIILNEDSSHLDQRISITPHAEVPHPAVTDESAEVIWLKETGGHHKWPQLYLHLQTDEAFGAQGANGVEVRVWATNSNFELDPQSVMVSYLRLSDDPNYRLTPSQPLVGWNTMIQDDVELDDLRIYQIAPAELTVFGADLITEVLDVGPPAFAAVCFDRPTMELFRAQEGTTPASVKSVKKQYYFGENGQVLVDPDDPNGSWINGGTPGGGHDPLDDPPETPPTDDPPRDGSGGGG